jgi:hypothetical protein
MEPLSLTQLESSAADADNTIPSSADQATPLFAASQLSTATDADGKPRRLRQKWSDEETADLIKGCAIHGVGSWKKYQRHSRVEMRWLTV